MVTDLFNEMFLNNKCTCMTTKLHVLWECALTAITSVIISDKHKTLQIWVVWFYPLNHSILPISRLLLLLWICLNYAGWLPQWLRACWSAFSTPEKRTFLASPITTNWDVGLLSTTSLQEIIAVSLFVAHNKEMRKLSSENEGIPIIVTASRY